MRYLHAFFLLGFMGVAVFSIFGMHAEMATHDAGCLAATAQGTTCPRENSLSEYLAFHLNAFKNFSLATLGKSLQGFLLALALAAAGIYLAIFFGNVPNPRLQLMHSGRSRWKFFDVLPQYEFVQWLALHENSPTAA